MTNGWTEYRLDELGTILNHKRVPLNSRERSIRQGKYPYYGASGIVDYIDEFVFEGEHVLISEDGENLRSRQTPVAFKADGQFWVNNHAHIFKGNSKWINDFVIYHFKNADINPYITGAVQPKLNKENLLSMRIAVPEQEELEGIVNILRSLDNKIELNRRMNQTLETIAQTLFTEWFVRFNFPGFDGELVDGLPKGWRMGTLGEIYKTTSGGTPSRAVEDFYQNGIIKWVKSKELNGSFIFDTEEHITNQALKNSSAKLLPRHSFLIAMYGATVGEYGILSDVATCNQAICAVIPNNDYPYTYFVEYFKSNRLKIINQAIGSAQQNISQALIQKLEIMIPDIGVLADYHSIVEDIFKKVEINLTENQTLTQLRDSLLPRLLSGQIQFGADA